MKKVELIPQTIIACCVLHNIFLQFDDNEWMNNLISEQQPNIGDDITAEQLNCYIENTQSGRMKRDHNYGFFNLICLFVCFDLVFVLTVVSILGFLVFLQ